jgi:hypothetical protein
LPPPRSLVELPETVRDAGCGERESDKPQGGIARRDAKDESKSTGELDRRAENRESVAPGNALGSSDAAKPARPTSLPQPLRTKMYPTKIRAISRIASANAGLRGSASGPAPSRVEVEG